jgi:hypothetical protein
VSLASTRPRLGCRGTPRVTSFASVSTIAHNLCGHAICSQILLLQERPDLVSLCLPNLGHFGPTLQVIEAGYPLLVENPLVFDLREAETLLNEAPRRDLRYTPEPATGPSNWPMRRSIRWRPDDAATV